MKVKYIQENDIGIDLTKDKIYDVIKLHYFKNFNQNWYVLIDDSEEDYCYPPEIFEVVEE